MACEWKGNWEGGEGWEWARKVYERMSYKNSVSESARMEHITLLANYKSSKNRKIKDIHVLTRQMKSTWDNTDIN